LPGCTADDPPELLEFPMLSRVERVLVATKSEEH